jgi:hypothetical protein
MESCQRVRSWPEAATGPLDSMDGFPANRSLHFHNVGENRTQINRYRTVAPTQRLKEKTHGRSNKNN